MALVGVRYIQDEDPGTPASCGYEWFRPNTNELFSRNQQNTEWVPVAMASLAVSGGAMVGAIGGASDLVTINTPDMNGIPTLGDKTIATVDDIKRVMETIRQEFEVIARGAINGANGGVSAKSSIGWAVGESGTTSLDTTGVAQAPNTSQTHTAQVPLPVGFLEEECAWITFMSDAYTQDFGSSGSGWQFMSLRNAKDFDGSKGGRDYLVCGTWGGNDPFGAGVGTLGYLYPGKFRYLIIGVK